MEAGTSMVFSGVGMAVLSSVIHLLGVSLLSYMLATKFSVKEMLHLTDVAWPRLLVVLNIVDAWAFVFTMGILIHGTGMELSRTVCLLGILNCVVFYASSKVFLYFFLVGKVYVVWSKRKRWRSKIYLACLAFVGVYAGIVVSMVVGRIAYFRGDGACIIGLSRPVLFALLIYDNIANVVLTTLFVMPLLDRRFTVGLRTVAIRNLWAAFAALTTSCVNIIVLTIMHGEQLAWVCLASCGADVVANAGILCWVTSDNHGGGLNINMVAVEEDSSSRVAVHHPGGAINRVARPRRSASSFGQRLTQMFALPAPAGDIPEEHDADDDNVELRSVDAAASTGNTYKVGTLRPPVFGESDLDQPPLRQAVSCPGLAPLLGGAPVPVRAHSSTVKRSDMRLFRYASGAVAAYPGPQVRALSIGRRLTRL